MKKIIYIFILLTGLLVSCSNDPIDIDSVKTKEPIYYNTLTITVDPSDLFSSYTYEDTYHYSTSLKDIFRSFHSKYNRNIHWRTLVYDKSSRLLVDSIVDYLSDTNVATKDLQLKIGEYYAVTTLLFTDTLNRPLWNVMDKEKLSTAKLEPRFIDATHWGIMSHSTEPFTISETTSTRLVTTPKPVGAVVCSYYQNFAKMENVDSLQYVSYWVKKYPLSYNLDPDIANKYNYSQDMGNKWHPKGADVYAGIIPHYTYSYIMDTGNPMELQFGYKLKNENIFHGYGDGTYTLESGKTYLAFWDYLYIGNPYFGVADNNHWDRSK